jgi:hypothetical protein
MKDQQMTQAEAIKLAGPGYKLEGLTDEWRVVGFRVLNKDGEEIARFPRSGDRAALAQPLELDMGTAIL